MVQCFLGTALLAYTIAYTHIASEPWWVCARTPKALPAGLAGLGWLRRRKAPALALGTRDLIAIIIIGARIPAIPRGEALVGIRVIAIPRGDIRTVTRIPTRAISSTVSKPGPAIIIPVAISMAPTVSPIIPVIASTIMVVPTIPVSMTPVTIAVPMLG
jgi:hypothetical protein